MAKITKDIPLKDLISEHPEAATELAKMGLGCVGCFAAQFETLEQGLKTHGMNVDDVVEKLNDIVSEDQE